MQRQVPSQRNEAKQIGIWIRVSTDDQAKGESPEHHEARGRAYARLKNWDVIEVYHLEAVSGKSVMEHPETKRMLEDVKAGRIEGLIFSKLARLARNIRELLDFSDLFRDAGADLISLQESIDTSSPAGRLFYNLLASMAQWEREEIADRVAASVPIRAQLGKPLGGAAPFGYRWENKRLVLDPAEAPIRKMLFDIFLQTKRLRTTASLMNDRGYRTRDGGLWSDTTVGRLIEDPVAKGKRRVNYTKSLGNGKHWTKKPETDWVVQDVPAVVSEEAWEEANRIREATKSKIVRPPKHLPVYLFSGLVVCTCGQKMYSQRESVSYRCRACKKGLNREDLEAIFVEQLKSFLTSTDDITAQMEKADAGIQAKEGHIAALRKNLEKLHKDMNALFELYQGGHISGKGFGERNRPLEAQAAQIENELPRLQAEVDVARINLISSDESLAEAQSLYAHWPNLGFDERRSIVENILSEVVVGDGELDFRFAYLSPQTSRNMQHIDTGSSQPRA